MIFLKKYFQPKRPRFLKPRTFIGYCCILFLFAGCKKEINPTFTESNIRYKPLGENSFITKVVDFDNNSFLVKVNNNKVVKISGENLKQDWECSFDNKVYDIISGNNAETFVIEGNYSEINFSHLDANGNVLYKGLNILSEFPFLQKQFLGACSDRKNGVYILTYLNDPALAPLANRRFLVHINSNNIIDQKVELYGFYMYLESDNVGNLFITRTTGPEGTIMQLETSKINMDWLKSNNSIKKDFIYKFGSQEADWKWPLYFPFKIIYNNSQLHIFKQHNTGKNDMCSGLDVIRLNSADLSLINSYTIPLDIEINNYLDQPTFYPLFTESGNYLSFNYGKKAKFVKADLSDTIVGQEYLSGNQNSCHITGMAATGGKVMVFGYSTLLKSPTYIPFVYFFKKT